MAFFLSDRDLTASDVNGQIRAAPTTDSNRREALSRRFKREAVAGWAAQGE
jgi:hypothetical protein